MAHVEGRGIRKPILSESLMGDQFVIRIDDEANPVMWLTLAFGPEEIGAMTRRYIGWLANCGDGDALHQFQKGVRG